MSAGSPGAAGAAPFPSSLRHPGARLLGRIRVAVFAACLLPLARLAVLAATGGLTANPIEFVARSTGTWALVLLLATLAVTPLRRLSGLHWLIRLRRMLGLFAFFYACLHLAVWLVLDQFFDLAAIVDDVLKRPFITAGFAAFVLMLPLALTSSDAMVRRLGGRRWQRLHRLVYAVGVAAVVHYAWLVKADLTEPVVYGAVLALLLGVRLWWRVSGSRGGAGASCARRTADPRSRSRTAR